jgi:small subunit ribosomal protein S10e
LFLLFYLIGYSFVEGILVAVKDLKPQAKHNEIDVPNLYVIKLMLSLKSRKFVREQFTWNHFYYFLTNEGIEYLREYLHLPQDVVPATLKKKPGSTGERPQGERPSGAGRGFRARAPKEGAGDFKPSFEVPMFPILFLRSIL